MWSKVIDDSKVLLVWLAEVSKSNVFVPVELSNESNRVLMLHVLFQIVELVAAML